ncbi:MAG: hypothetical protein QS98_C0011G0069 [archaeon GW2011_AR3]|nr:MAG: hypothetical protein QS98_C0011G0069 [archaeon GW2011_AR3]MBS3109667.1 ribosome biogenesis protein [Candidatus Woesearchaeota archaeon]
MRHILKCPECGNYSMEDACSNGHAPVPTANPKPAKYSPDDHYGEYRRKAKLEKWQSEGLL